MENASVNRLKSAGVCCSDIRLEDCLDLIEVILVALNERGEVTCVNEKGCRLLGYGKSEILGKNWFDHFLPPEERTKTEAVFQGLMSGNGKSGEYHENPVLTKTGEKRLIAWRNSFVADANGKVLGTIASGVDITERRISEELNRYHERRLQTIIDNMVDGLIVIDATGRIETLNASAGRIFGYTSDELMGRNVKILMSDPFIREHDGYIQRYRKSGIPRIIGFGREVQGMRKDGTTFPMALAVSEMRFGEALFFVGNIRDLTEEQRMRERVRQSEKLSAIGLLVAGIAHEIGGALSVISGNAQFLDEALDESDHRKSDVEGIIRECDAVASLLRRLLNFSRPAELELQPVDLNESIRNVFFLIRKQANRENIDVKLDLQVGLPQVMGDPNQLEQVFMNLVLNACHAMPKGGTLIIRSFLKQANGSGRDDFVCVDIEDSGEGIPEENIGRLFELYFSTRKDGRGTGLGLPLSKRIVEGHGGAISVRSVLGEGTGFTVELPAAVGKGTR